MEFKTMVSLSLVIIVLVNMVPATPLPKDGKIVKSIQFRNDTEPSDTEPSDDGSFSVDTEVACCTISGCKDLCDCPWPVDCHQDADNLNCWCIVDGLRVERVGPK